MNKVFILLMLSAAFGFGFSKKNYLNRRFKSSVTKSVNCKNVNYEKN